MRHLTRRQFNLGVLNRRAHFMSKHRLHPINNNNALSNNHAFVVGMLGSGKTSFVKKKLLKSTDQVAIYDPKREYQGQLAGRQVRSYDKLKNFARALLVGEPIRALR
jgi:type II secretory pathway predicted ATPase ExeA